MYRNVRRCRACGIFGWICRRILFWSCTTGPLLTTCLTVLRCGIAQLSMGWVGHLGHGLGWVGSGWVHYSKSTLKFWKDFINAFKARLDKIWLHQAVKFVSCIGLGRVGSIFFHLRWVVLGQSADGLGWIGSHKMDQWTTLWYRAGGWLRCSMQSLSSSSSRSSVVSGNTGEREEGWDGDGKKMRNFCAYFLDGNPGTGTLYVQTVKMADIIITVNGHYTGQPALAGTSS